MVRIVHRPSAFASISALLVLFALGAVAALWPPVARADGAPAPGGAVRLRVQLLASDAPLDLRLAPDGAAQARWVPKEGQEEDERGGAADASGPLAYAGRWCLGPGRLDVRLSASEGSVAALSGLAGGPARWLDLQVRAAPGASGLRAQHRFNRESWVPSRLAKVAAGKLPPFPTQVAAPSPLSERQSLAAVFAEAPFVYAVSGRLRVCLGCTNRGDDVLEGVTVAVRPSVPRGSGGPERTVVLPGTLEPSEYRRFVDLDAGPWPEGKEPTGRRVDATVAVRSARVVAGAAGRGPRLRGRSMPSLLSDVEVLFAWPADEDRYVALVRNRGEEERAGIGLEVVYRDGKGAVLERLPLPLDRPLAPGEVRLLRDAAPTPRGATGQRYYLFALDSVRIELRAAYPPVGEPRFGSDAAKVYDGIGVARLRLGGSRGAPVFSFELSNSGKRPLEAVQLVFAGTDAKQNLVALATAPLPAADDGAAPLRPNETRPCRVRVQRLYGIPGAVLTWTVVVGDLELGGEAPPTPRREAPGKPDRSAPGNPAPRGDGG